MAPTLISRLRKAGANRNNTRGGAIPTAPKMVHTSYTSLPVDIPDDFLSQPASDAQPVTKKKIDFENTELPEYISAYAVVLDNALSPSECATLLRLAEESAGTGNGGDGWKQAMVNAGQNIEVLATNYRNSDRIIWDSREVADRLWKRCLTAEGIADELSTIEKNLSIQGPKAVERGERWKFTRVNERLRFLRYGPGQFFQAHCDGSYVNLDANPTERTHYTLHLYLNDDGVEGGATAFHSIDNTRHLNVDAKLGRILIFQHRGLLHSGEEVLQGTKYTVRSDLLFQLEMEEE